MNKGPGIFLKLLKFRGNIMSEVADAFRWSSVLIESTASLKSELG